MVPHHRTADMAVPPEYETSDLLSDQLLQKGHQHISGACVPSIVFTNGSRYTMDITDGHKIVRTQPVNPELLPPDFPRIMLQDNEVYTAYMHQQARRY